MEYHTVEVEPLAAVDCMPAFEVMSDEASYFHCCIGSPCHFVLGSGGRQLREFDTLHLNSFVARYHSLELMPDRSLWRLESESTAANLIVHIGIVMYEGVGEGR